MAAEDWYRRQHHPKQRADLVVSGGPGMDHDPEREFLGYPTDHALGSDRK